jgi:F0F1-type ATP synthase assembly protein I
MFQSEMSDRPAQTHEQRDPAEPRSSDGWTSVSILLSGCLVWGGIGWLADALLGFQALFLPIGMVLGLAGAIYLIVHQLSRS